MTSVQREGIDTEWCPSYVCLKDSQQGCDKGSKAIEWNESEGIWWRKEDLGSRTGVGSLHV